MDGVDGAVTMSPAAPSPSLPLFDGEAGAAADDEAALAGDDAKFFLRGIWNSSMVVIGFENIGCSYS